MIVLDANGGWEVLFQRNHALLAGALALELAACYRPKAWIETLAAVIQHDDAQASFTEETHIDRNGMPLDFRNFGENLLQAERVVYEAQFKSKYMMLLVSMHAHALRAPKKVKSPELKAYLARQEALQKELLAHLHITSDEIQEAYLFLRWCDECSLILCENRLNAESIRIETGQLTGLPKQHIHRAADGCVYMEPWCFAHDSFQVTAEYYTLPSRSPFASSVDLQHALLGIKPATRTWHFRKGP